MIVFKWQVLATPQHFPADLRWSPTPPRHVWPACPAGGPGGATWRDSRRFSSSLSLVWFHRWYTNRDTEAHCYDKRVLHIWTPKSWISMKQCAPVLYVIWCWRDQREPKQPRNTGPSRTPYFEFLVLCTRLMIVCRLNSPIRAFRSY